MSGTTKDFNIANTLRLKLSDYLDNHLRDLKEEMASAVLRGDDFVFIKTGDSSQTDDNQIYNTARKTAIASDILKEKVLGIIPNAHGAFWGVGPCGSTSSGIPTVGVWVGLNKDGLDKAQKIANHYEHPIRSLFKVKWPKPSLHITNS